jgi:hypothetical protein
MRIMRTIDDLLNLADDCYRHARATSDLLVRLELNNMGDEYLRTVERMQRDRSVILDAFPKPDAKIG